MTEMRDSSKIIAYDTM